MELIEPKLEYKIYSLSPEQLQEKVNILEVIYKYPKATYTYIFREVRTKKQEKEAIKSANAKLEKLLKWIK